MTAPARRPRRRVLLSTVSSDSHTWNLVFLQLLLEESGNEVINLGSCVPDDVILDAVRAERFDAVVISSVNGHGFLDGRRVIKKLRSIPEGDGLPVMIGGKLGILGDGNDRYSDELVAAGFDAVFSDSTSPEALTDYLRGLPGARLHELVGGRVT
ncbi:cobalamin-dependent protein [Streptomyces sp. SID9124]|uniref:cobalamin B12-binding domain-containing protein n=1 Tax=Streptomyces sp. SID9124 TaxID=2706108 RepID=UPI0013DF294A|nr:cobalamin-dependent protein [Streptomyces sp. SID9124]NED11120.1 methylmalonyl-CoA mutase [Streptomyces sp. SID9124]